MGNVFDVRKDWQIGNDGMPINPTADKACPACSGHGVMEDGTVSQFGSVLIDCPICVSKMNRSQLIAAGHLGLLKFVVECQDDSQATSNGIATENRAIC